MHDTFKNKDYNVLEFEISSEGKDLSFNHTNKSLLPAVSVSMVQVKSTF